LNKKCATREEKENYIIITAKLGVRLDTRQGISGINPLPSSRGKRVLFE
jgi:hypothetical protein